MQNINSVEMDNSMYLLKNKMNLLKNQGFYTVPKEQNCHHAEIQEKKNIYVHTYIYSVYKGTLCKRERKKNAWLLRQAEI